MNKSRQRTKRKNRIRSKLRQNRDKPRVSVFRSNRHVYVQVIDDNLAKTLASFSDLKLKKKSSKSTKSKSANLVGTELGKLLKKIGIKEVVFDRGAFKYHGRVKSLAEGLRKEGIQF
jgi:large subunit ribosomal protein L18